MGVRVHMGPDTELQTQHLSVVSLKIDAKGLNPKVHVTGQLVIIVDCSLKQTKAP